VALLPPDWRISEEAFQDESWYWPVRQLKMLARLPHKYRTWLWLGHTVPNDDPPEPFAPSTELCCSLLTLPLSTAPPNKVSIIPSRHSRVRLAGIQKKSLDARLRGHDGWISDTHLCGAVLSLPRDFMALKAHRIKTIIFFTLVPLYQEEMELKLQKGTDELLNRFSKAGITDVIDPHRQNVCNAPPSQRLA
jgi:hypothetical protein